MKYTIRNAKPTDIHEIIMLCAEHAEYEAADYSPEGKAEKLSTFLFSDKPTIFCLIAESENVVIGYAIYMFEFSTWDAGFYAHMDCLYLRKHARGFGIGELLVKEIAKAACENNCTAMQWQTPATNTRAIKFYHSLGALSKEKTRLYINQETINKLIK